MEWIPLLKKVVGRVVVLSEPARAGIIRRHTMSPGISACEESLTTILRHTEDIVPLSVLQV